MKLTSSERRAIFRPNVMLQRLDMQEAKFVRNAMNWVRIQAENIMIQYAAGVAVNRIVLNPKPVRGIAESLSNSMIDTYSLGEISIQNELLQAEQIRRAKQNRTYEPNIVPFAAMRKDELDDSGNPFTPKAGLNWYKDYTLRLAGVHSVDALEYAKGVITTGIQQGSAQQVIMNGLREQFTSFSEHRLENIARTETAKIYEQARYQTMNGNEEVVGYEFAAVMDSRTSAICADRDGKFVQKGHEEGWLPPLHYQCRSVLLPIFGWESGIKYSNADMAVKPMDGFGSTDMVIPETARNKIFIGGIPELRKTIKIDPYAAEHKAADDWLNKVHSQLTKIEEEYGSVLSKAKFTDLANKRLASGEITQAQYDAMVDKGYMADANEYAEAIKIRQQMDAIRNSNIELPKPKTIEKPIIAVNPQEEALSRIGKDIQNLKVEHAYVINTKGEEVYFAKGTKKKIVLTNMGNKAENNILIHNHPNAKNQVDNLSPADLSQMVRRNMQGMQAISPYSICKVSRIKEWSVSADGIKLEYELEMTKQLKQWRLTHIVRKIALESGKSVEQVCFDATAEIAHNVMLKLSTKYNFAYSRELL